jgi:hypothetical protein
MVVHRSGPPSLVEWDLADGFNVPVQVCESNIDMR